MPTDLTEYQRGYVDGFDAPANVEARIPVTRSEPRASGLPTCGIRIACVLPEWHDGIHAIAEPATPPAHSPLDKATYILAPDIERQAQIDGARAFVAYASPGFDGENLTYLERALARFADSDHASVDSRSIMRRKNVQTGKPMDEGINGLRQHCQGCSGSVSSMGGLDVYDCEGVFRI